METLRFPGQTLGVTQAGRWVSLVDVVAIVKPIGEFPALLDYGARFYTPKCV